MKRHWYLLMGIASLLCSLALCWIAAKNYYNPVVAILVSTVFGYTTGYYFQEYKYFKGD